MTKTLIVGRPTDDQTADMARDNQSLAHQWIDESLSRLSRTSRPCCEKAIGFLLHLSPFIKVNRLIGDFRKIEISKLYVLLDSLVS